MGGRLDPAHEKRSPQAEDAPVALDPQAVTFAAYYYVTSVPPVTDQGQTPQCVAFSSAYDQNQQDRPEMGKFETFDKGAFFTAIGGTSAGAYMTNALTQRQTTGYATVAGGDAAMHKVSGSTQLAVAVDPIKAALKLGHGVLLTTTWYHSWFHPFTNGKLPAPDYAVGGHAIWIRGWNDIYGFRLRNSWGATWGLSGDCYLPYAFLAHVFGAYRTTDV